MKRETKIGREELYSDIEEMSKPTWIFILLVILSSVVAAVGILRNNVPAVIGAMVIAPLLGPNVALALSTTLADFNLARRALRANFSGILIILFFAGLVGVFLEVDPTLPEISSRTHVSIADIILALAAGGAATLSLTTAAPGALIGVMVAVALLPPLVTLGLLLGSGYWINAGGAALLLLSNLICINLAGVLTFFIQGIRPLRWWDANKAKKATRIAILLWSTLLVILILAILLSHRT